MAVSGITPGTQVAPVQPAAEARPSGASGGSQTSFVNLLASSLKDVNAQQLQAQQQVEGLATGAAENIHDVVLHVAQADMAFRLVVEIRNRLIASYQELMRMQV